MALRKEQFDDPHERDQGMENERLSKKHRVIIDIDFDLYNYLETAAYAHEQSISEYISTILYRSRSQAASTTQYLRPLTPETLARVMAARQKILENTHGETFEDSTELIRRMRSGNLEEPDQL